ncbi:hypothetical protein SLEP1_g25469 [Rubroshorea leprosula]|uniref:Cytochrome P450 n=1 Tax=Rubroshorea leprosula TaxID=152421 RepID=A0AAV5JQA2_9ROSI|nr:hypothetical protein SLEP1_g25469 [Rubroshorea leprosula]
MAVYTLIISFVLLLPVLQLLLKKKFKNRRRQKQLPPGPPAPPIIGNLHQIGAIPHNSFCQLSKKYGPVLLLHLGRIPVVLVSSAEAARDVLKVHDLACCNRPQFVGSRKLTYNFQDIAFSPYSENWRQKRKITTLELFSTKRVQSFRFIREEEVASLMHLITQCAVSTTAVDLGEKIFALTGSILFRMSFGTSLQGSTIDLKKLIHGVVTVLGGFTANEHFPYVGWILDPITGVNVKVEKVFKKLDPVLEQVVNDHLKPGRTEKHQDIIDVLLATQREETDQDGDLQQMKNGIKAVLLNIFLGGIDTTAITVLWAMAELVRKPRLMRKAQIEIRNYVGNKGRVTEDDLDQLQYLKIVVKETLRLHPPVPLLVPRETMSPCKIGGYDISPKTVIQINAWAIARDPKYWTNPEEFSPERFADSSVDFKGQNFEFLPFGSGRRVCPGILLGIITAELLLANLLYCFDWKIPDGMKEEDINMEEEVGASLTVGKKTPLLLVPVNYLQ